MIASSASSAGFPPDWGEGASCNEVVPLLSRATGALSL
jgi:hypothetical protein